MGFLMNIMKNIIVVLLMVNVVPLCAMEIEIYKNSEFAMDVESQKFDDYSSVRNALLFVKTMQERDNITEDVAGMIVYKSCLLRKNSIYKQFDLFFHFGNDNYAKMISDYNEKKDLYINAAATDQDIKYFADIFSISAHGKCRKFDILEPHHLIFLTEKQDKILSSLVNRPECFHGFKGTYSFQMTEKEHESFLMLPYELRELLSIYPIFVRPVFVSPAPFDWALSSDEDFDSTMDGMDVVF